MDILNGKYKLEATQAGVSIVDKETGKQAFFLKEGRDFSMFKRGDIYVIGCLTITEEQFETAIDEVKKFQETTLVEHQQQLTEAYKTNPGYLKMLENTGGTPQ